jgi:hypothetical protein
MNVSSVLPRPPVVEAPERSPSVNGLVNIPMIWASFIRFHQPHPAIFEIVY